MKGKFGFSWMRFPKPGKFQGKRFQGIVASQGIPEESKTGNVLPKKFRNWENSPNSPWGSTFLIKFPKFLGWFCPSGIPKYTRKKKIGIQGSREFPQEFQPWIQAGNFGNFLGFFFPQRHQEFSLIPKKIQNKNSQSSKISGISSSFRVFQEI